MSHRSPLGSIDSFAPAHSPSRLPVYPAAFPARRVLGAIVSVQAGAALAKGLFPALGPIGTVGLRVVLSATILMAAFRPRLRALSPAQWRAVIPYGLVLGTTSVIVRFHTSVPIIADRACDYT